MLYLNMKTQHGTETVDQLEVKDFADFKSFRVEVKRLIQEYRTAGMNVYQSSRACKDW